MIPRFVDICHVLLLDDPVPNFFKDNDDDMNDSDKESASDSAEGSAEVRLVLDQTWYVEFRIRI